MKTLLIGLTLFFSLNDLVHSKVSFIEDSWKNSFTSNGPSCPLYRKRVANYYQRLSEVHNSNKAMQGTLGVQEVNRLLDLWKRTGIPLSIDDTATYKVTYKIDEEDKKFFEAKNSVVVSSPLFNWVSDKFIFPESIMRASVSPENVLEIEVDLNYSQACLNQFSLELESKTQDGEVLAIEMYMNKYKWDIEN